MSQIYRPFSVLQRWRFFVHKATYTADAHPWVARGFLAQATAGSPARAMAFVTTAVGGRG
jgi:hypothetical protein